MGGTVLRELFRVKQTCPEMDPAGVFELFRPSYAYRQMVSLYLRQMWVHPVYCFKILFLVCYAMFLLLRLNNTVLQEVCLGSLCSL